MLNVSLFVELVVHIYQYQLDLGKRLRLRRGYSIEKYHLLLFVGCSWVFMGCSWVVRGLFVGCSWVVRGLFVGCSWVLHADMDLIRDLNST
jgi:hypothetical protein